MPFPLFPVLFITAIFYLGFTARVILAPLLPVVETELHIGHAAAGSLFLFVQVGLAAGLITSGFVSASLSYRRTIAASAVGVGLGLLLLSQAGSLSGIRLGLVAVGVTAGLYLPAGVPAITDLVAERHWGKALALHELAPTFAFFSAPLAAEVILRFLRWQGVLTVLGVVAVAVGGAFAVWGRGGTRVAVAPDIGTMLRMLATPSAWMVGLLFAVGVGVSMGLFTVMTLFLVNDVGMARGAANGFIGTSRLLAIPVLFATGLLVDRLGPRRSVALAQWLTGSVALLLGLVHNTHATLALVLLQAGSAACFFPAGFALISQVFPPALRGLGISMAGTVGTVVGAGLVPSAVGYLAEVASFRLAFALVGLVALASPLLLRLHPTKDLARQ
jgi:NNP family nitrate/nitrite transporter-like MFS transporter